MKAKKEKLKKRIEDISLGSYVVFSISVILLYSIIEFLFSTITGISHDTLSTCLFALFGGEVLSCALIKIFKLKEEDKEVLEDE